ncbi:hypothetical protein H4R33_000625 [Dimargaris cristalligena]|nr:hypothetical protein H4R33_000625 [Dimargaris cristalligena]
MGRKKIQIRKIENDRQKTVTFARRRAGLIKKAHEIAVLCGVKVTLLIFDQKDACHLYSSEENTDSLIVKYFTKQYTTNESKRRKDLMAGAAVPVSAGQDANSQSYSQPASQPPSNHSVATFSNRRRVAVVNEYKVVSVGAGSEDIAVKSDKKFYDPDLNMMGHHPHHPHHQHQQHHHHHPGAHTESHGSGNTPGGSSAMSRPPMPRGGSHFVPIAPFQSKRPVATRPNTNKRTLSHALMDTPPNHGDKGTSDSMSELLTPDSQPASTRLMKVRRGMFSNLTRTNSLPPNVGINSTNPSAATPVSTTNHDVPVTSMYTSPNSTLFSPLPFCSTGPTPPGSSRKEATLEGGGGKTIMGGGAPTHYPTPVSMGLGIHHNYPSPMDPTDLVSFQAAFPDLKSGAEGYELATHNLFNTLSNRNAGSKPASNMSTFSSGPPVDNLRRSTSYNVATPTQMGKGSTDALGLPNMYYGFQPSLPNAGETVPSVQSTVSSINSVNTNPNSNGAHHTNGPCEQVDGSIPGSFANLGLDSATIMELMGQTPSMESFHMDELAGLNFQTWLSEGCPTAVPTE